MLKPLSLASHYLRNTLKICEFAITNICTAECDFCSIWRQKKKVTVDLDTSLRLIEHLSRLGVKFITFTGGEPMLHPHFARMIDQCTRRHIYSAILNADARLFNQKRLDALQKSQVDVVCISIDHHTNEIMSASRKISNLLYHIEKAVGELRKRRIKSLASILICKFNHQSLRELFRRCAEYGFDMISLNYPIFSQSAVYTLGGEAIDLSKEEVVRALESVLDLKDEFKNIVNPAASLKNIIAFLKGQTPEFPCVGGSKAFFIDWYFNAHPCMFLKENMGPALHLTEKDCRRPPCNQCSMSWYRDFSLYFQGVRSTKLVLASLPAVLRGNRYSVPPRL